jgi:hypothetical protein
VAFTQSMSCVNILTGGHVFGFAESEPGGRSHRVGEFFVPPRLRVRGQVLPVRSG